MGKWLDIALGVAGVAAVAVPLFKKVQASAAAKPGPIVGFNSQGQGVDAQGRVSNLHGVVGGKIDPNSTAAKLAEQAVAARDGRAAGTVPVPGEVVRSATTGQVIGVVANAPPPKPLPLGTPATIPPPSTFKTTSPAVAAAQSPPIVISPAGVATVAPRHVASVATPSAGPVVVTSPPPPAPVAQPAPAPPPVPTAQMVAASSALRKYTL